MVISTASRALLLAGIALVSLGLRCCHPVPYQRRFQESGTYKRIAMLKTSCFDSIGNRGICMFKWDCMSQKGITLSTCANGFLFGACCYLSENVHYKQTVDHFYGINTHFKQTSRISLLQSAVPGDLTLQKINSTTSQVASVDVSTKLSMESKKKLFSTSDELTTVQLSEESVNTSTTSTNSTAISDTEDIPVISIYLFPNISQSEKMVHDILKIPNEEFSSFTELTMNDKLVQGWNLKDRNNEYNNSKQKNTAAESKNATQSLMKERQAIIQNESHKHENHFTSVSNGRMKLYSEVTVENQFASPNSIPLNFSTNKYSFTNISENSFYASNGLKPDEVVIFDYNTFKSENAALKIRNESKLLSKEINNEEKSSFSIINIAKATENATTKEIIPLIWDNYTSFLPSSFNVLISQLTSRDVGEINYVLPTVESNWTFNTFNAKHTKVHVPLLSKLHNNSFHQQSNFQNVNMRNSLRAPNLQTVQFLESHSTDTTERFAVTSYEPESADFFNISTISNNNMKNQNKTENLPVSRTEKVIFVNHAFSGSDISSATQSLEILKNERNAFQVFCNKENDLVGNCTKYFPDSESDKIYASSYANKNVPNKNSYSLVTDTSVSHVKGADKSQERDKLKTLPGTIHIESDEQHGKTVNPFNGILKYKEEGENVVIPQERLSLPSNGHFGLDLRAEILKHSTKLQINDAFSVSFEQSVRPTANKIERSTIASQTIWDNGVTPSHLPTVSLMGSTETTVIFNAILNELPIQDSTSTETNENAFYLNNGSLSTKKYNSQQTTNIYEHINFLTQNNNKEIIELDDLNTESNIHTKSVNFSTIPTMSDFRSSTTNSLYKIKSNTTYQHEMISSPSTTFSIWQNFTNKYSLPVKSSMPTIISNISSPESLMNDSSHRIRATPNMFETTFSNSTGNDILPMAFLVHDMIHFENYSAAVRDSSLNEMFATNSKSPFETTEIDNTWNYQKDCGVRPIQAIGRIVGGRNTYFGKWPWQALVKEATWLGLFVKNKCGGVLITSKYVLTAAHCQPGFLASLLVVLGIHDLNNMKENSTPVIRNVKRMVVHRHYNPITFENDLALLEMDIELEFLPQVVPICLPHRNEDFTGEMAFVTGWGKLTHGGDVPNILQEVQVPIVSNSDCQMMFYEAGYQKAIQNNFVCAGYTNGGQDSCEGDSGGPLMIERQDKRWLLVGTVSHGIGCADPNLPGVYMRMASYRPWIDSIINI